MNSKKFILVSLFLSTMANAQSTVETSIGDLGANVGDYISKHFSASYHGEFSAARRDIDSENAKDRNIGDLKIMHNPTLVYKPTENWQALATAEFKFSDQPKENAGAGFPNGFYRGLFSLTRKNILNEKDHLVQLDAGIARRQYSTGRAQQKDGDFPLSNYGSNRVFTTLTKNINKHSGSLLVQYMNNEPKYVSAKTWKNNYEIKPTINLQLTDRLTYTLDDDINISTPKLNAEKSLSITHEMNVGVLSFQVNDKISTYYQLKYIHDEDFSNKFASQNDSFENYLGVGYSFTPKATATLEIGNELARSRDGRDVLSKNVSYPELALYVDVAI